MENNFKGYKEPIGTIINLREDSPRGRLANYFFRREMFRYFEDLTYGKTGWGISFADWLNMHGWKLIEYRTFERIEGMEDLEKSD